MYTDTSGEQQSVLLGNVADLRTVKVKEVGGIPIEKLQAHYEHQRNQRGKRDRGMPSSIVGFPDDRQIELPPNAVKVYEVGKLPTRHTSCSDTHTGRQLCSLAMVHNPVIHICLGYSVVQCKAVCVFVASLVNQVDPPPLAGNMGRVTHYSTTVNCASQDMNLRHVHDTDL